ncbi:MAG TPA: efflux RND transporter periplasmic adaptor subunit [Allosphingosinicella sp.]
MSTELAEKLRRLKLQPETVSTARAAPVRRASVGGERKGAFGRHVRNAGIVAAIGAFAFWSGSRTAGAPVSAAPPAAEAGAAATGAAAEPGAFTASGHIVARRQATIAAQSTGMIESIAVQEGQRVERGALIARLDARSTEAGLDRALALTRAGAADVDRLSALHREAAAVQSRYDALAERGFARMADVEHARAQRAALEAEIRRARAQQAGNAADAQAAAISVDRTSIRAPFAGVVTRLSAQPGEIISPVSAGGGFTRTGICTIVDMNSLEVEVDVSEAQIARVAVGHAAEITLQAYPNRPYPGRVLAVVPVADRARASFRVRVAIERTDERMLPEMAARVSFKGKA